MYHFGFIKMQQTLTFSPLAIMVSWQMLSGTTADWHKTAATLCKKNSTRPFQPTNDHHKTNKYNPFQICQ
jgi:hypothetical protein